HIKIEEVNEVNEDMLIDGNVDSLDLNDELVNNDVYNDLTEIEQDKKDGNQK
ncbi:3425_t:CDS:1, partial [Gigaspora margarita]